jgi:hypothetical protein
LQPTCDVFPIAHSVEREKLQKHNEVKTCVPQERGRGMRSTNGRYRFYMKDKCYVLEDDYRNEVLWKSRSGCDEDELVMQHDGNLVCYGAFVVGQHGVVGWVELNCTD